MPAAFPHAYALILFEGYGETRDPAVARSPNEAGPPNQRKTKSRVLTTRPAKILLRSKADYQAFLTWYSATINEGADWFDFTDPRDNVVKTARIRADQPLEAKALRKQLDRWIIPLAIETWSA